MWKIVIVLVYKVRNSNFYGVQWYAANHAFVLYETGTRDLGSEWPCDNMVIMPTYTLTLLLA